METELCNMCMVTDAEGRVLVQERLPKPSNPWSVLNLVDNNGILNNGENNAL